MACSNESSRAKSDLELLQAAFPDEVSLVSESKCRLHFSDDVFLEMTFPACYPSEPIQVTSQRSCAKQKSRLEAAVAAVRQEASNAQEEEHGLACCMAALQVWNTMEENETVIEKMELAAKQQQEVTKQQHLFTWLTGEPLTDRKSVFVAHVCRVSKEQDVQNALDQLLDGNSKLQRASHNMYAWRVTEQLQNDTLVEKHDNDNDGEDGAGSRLAHLLQVRKERNVLVVVSRWFGGTHLGPKRFAHIANVAQQALEQLIQEECQNANTNGKKP